MISATADPLTRRIADSYFKTRNQMRYWTEISDGRYIAAREAALGDRSWLGGFYRR